MKTLKLKSIKHGEKRLEIIIKKEKLFLKYIPEMLEELKIRFEPSYIPKRLDNVEEVIETYSNKKIDFNIIYFKKQIGLIIYGSEKEVNKAKKILVKYMSFGKKN